jgi:putative effector of murein hydrolase
LLTLVWVLILLVSILVWFVVVVPIQYAVYLVCGAPIRFMLGSERLAIARFAGNQLHAHEIDKRETVPEGWENISVSKSPVSMTNIIGALLFGILRAFVN